MDEGEAKYIRELQADQYQKIHRNTDRIVELERAMMHRIGTLEQTVECLNTDLVGKTGSNGFRGEFRQFRADQEQWQQSVYNKLNRLEENRYRMFKWTITIIIGIPTLMASIYGAMQIFGNGGGA